MKKLTIAAVLAMSSMTAFGSELMANESGDPEFLDALFYYTDDDYANDRDVNMMWESNEDFHSDINQEAIDDYHMNMMWESNEDFHNVIK